MDFLKLGLLITTLICIAIATLITTDKLRDRRFKWYNYKSYTTKGKFLALLNIVVFTSSIWQYNINENEIQAKERLQDKKDSINAKNINDNTKKNFREFTDVLAKNYLSLDSTSKRLVKIIRDSAKTKIIENIAPVLGLADESGIRFHSIKDSLYRFDLDIVSSDASSAGIDCTIHCLMSDSKENYYYVDSTYLFDTEMIIPTNGMRTKYTYFKVPIADINIIYIILQGTYMNLDRTKSYKLNSTYYYNFIGKTDGIVSGNTKKILNLIIDAAKKGYKGNVKL